MIYRLIFNVKTVLMNTLRDALSQDPLINPYSSGNTQVAIPKILDGWGYQIREFPCVIISSSTAKNRRTGIGDYVADQFVGGVVDNKNFNAQRWGGWFDLSFGVTAIGRNTTEREQLVDKIETILWYTKKTELREKSSIIIQDISFDAESEVPYASDFLYAAGLTLTCSTEWQHDAGFTTVKDVVISQIEPTAQVQPTE